MSKNKLTFMDLELKLSDRSANFIRESESGWIETLLQPKGKMQNIQTNVDSISKNVSAVCERERERERERGRERERVKRIENGE